MLTLCARCGGVTEASPKHPGYGVCCRPDPDAFARRASDVEARHEWALHRATIGFGGGIDDLDRPWPAAAHGSPAGPRPNPRPAVATTTPGNHEIVLRHLQATARWHTAPRLDTAHLFVGDNRRSACGKVEVAGTVVAPHGLRGCRRCAKSVKLITSQSEMVTT